MEIKVFLTFFCLTMEISGSVLMMIGSGSGRPKYLRIRIQTTGYFQFVTVFVEPRHFSLQGGDGWNFKSTFRDLEDARKFKNLQRLYRKYLFYYRKTYALICN